LSPELAAKNIEVAESSIKPEGPFILFNALKPICMDSGYRVRWAVELQKYSSSSSIDKFFEHSFLIV
jgi:hypothetical protein